MNSEHQLKSAITQKDQIIAYQDKTKNELKKKLEVNNITGY